MSFSWCYTGNEFFPKPISTLQQQQTICQCIHSGFETNQQFGITNFEKSILVVDNMLCLAKEKTKLQEKSCFLGKLVICFEVLTNFLLL